MSVMILGGGHIMGGFAAETKNAYDGYSSGEQAGAEAKDMCR